MIITWEVDDGYSGGAAPHHLEIDDDEFEGMDEVEKEVYINEAVQEDFDNQISWRITDKE